MATAEAPRFDHRKRHEPRRHGIHLVPVHPHQEVASDPSDPIIGTRRGWGTRKVEVGRLHLHVPSRVDIPVHGRSLTSNEIAQLREDTVVTSDLTRERTTAPVTLLRTGDDALADEQLYDSPFPQSWENAAKKAVEGVKRHIKGITMAVSGGLEAFGLFAQQQAEKLPSGFPQGVNLFNLPIDGAISWIEQLARVAIWDVGGKLAQGGGILLGLLAGAAILLDHAPSIANRFQSFRNRFHKNLPNNR